MRRHPDRARLLHHSLPGSGKRPVRVYSMKTLAYRCRRVIQRQVGTANRHRRMEHGLTLYRMELRPKGELSEPRPRVHLSPRSTAETWGLRGFARTQDKPRLVEDWK